VKWNLNYITRNNFYKTTPKKTPIIMEYFQFHIYIFYIYYIILYDKGFFLDCKFAYILLIIKNTTGMPHLKKFLDHAQRHPTVGKTPLEE